MSERWNVEVMHGETGDLKLQTVLLSNAESRSVRCLTNQQPQ
jgi:hypothetical protein